MEIINLGDIDDLKKETITNAIINYYWGYPTWYLESINIKEIALSYSKAEVITSLISSQVIKRISTIRFDFLPRSLQLQHIITNRNITIKPSINIHNTIIPTLRQHNHQYYNDSVWNEIRLVNHNIQPSRNTNINTINFQQLLQWSPALNSIQNNDPFPINVSVSTLQLHSLSIIKSLGNLGKLELVTDAVLLQKFQQLNPRIDTTNLQVIEIRQNISLLATNRSYRTITGSSVVTIRDNIDFHHPIYIDRITVTFSFQQRVHRNDTDLQKIVNNDQTNSKKSLN